MDYPLAIDAKATTSEMAKLLPAVTIIKPVAIQISTNKLRRPGTARTYSLPGLNTTFTVTGTDESIDASLVQKAFNTIVEAKLEQPSTIRI